MNLENQTAAPVLTPIKEINPVIALVGNPNTGKTTLFNSLCGARQRVGNYPGITVEKKIGSLKLDPFTVDVIDLPGLYSLKPVSPDEEVASDVIMGRMENVHSPDLVVFVLDATNLKRNLYLYSQVAELGIPVVVALTMTDMLDGMHIEVNLPELATRLGVPVIPISAGNRLQVQHLKEYIQGQLSNPANLKPSLPRYPEEMEKTAASLYDVLNRVAPISLFESRELLFATHSPILRFFEDNQEASAALSQARSIAASFAYGGPSRISLSRYNWIGGILEGVEKRNNEGKKSFSDHMDSLLTNRLLGPVFFSGIMYLVFRAIYSWSGPFMDFIDAFFGWAGEMAGQGLGDMPMIHSLVVDGIIGGVGSVVIFVPQIFILFIFIAFLEDSGYLSRAAFLMDKLLGWTGLNGRAFIPMLSSFACSIPGIMATRVMPDPRARMTTILVAPLMSCSARLPVYVLFIGAFIEPRFGAGWAAFSLFAMHGIGLFLAFPISWIMNKGVLKTPGIPFILEMPPYRLPRFYDVLYRGVEASLRFLSRAGTVIFAMSILIWFLSYFPASDEATARIEEDYSSKIETVIQEEGPEAGASRIEDLEKRREASISLSRLENSYLGMIGKGVQPIFAPLGFDWKISVGIISAFPAREVIVTTLGILFQTGDEESDTLKEQLGSATDQNGNLVYTPLMAITLMIFFALSSQCMSTIAMVWKELADWRWAFFLFTYMTVLAYLISIGVRWIGMAAGFE